MDYIIKNGKRVFVYETKSGKRIVNPKMKYIVYNKQRTMYCHTYRAIAQHFNCSVGLIRNTFMNGSLLKGYFIDSV